VAEYNYLSLTCSTISNKFQQGARVNHANLKLSENEYDANFNTSKVY
jgi:hypothetical protein